MAGDSSTEVRQALRALLAADAGVSAIVGTRILDRAEEGDEFPYITFGPEFHEPWDAHLIDGAEIFAQIDAWSKQDGQTVEIRALKAAIVNAVHDADLSVAGNTTVLCRVQRSNIFMDGEKQRIAHAVIRVRIITH